MPFLCYRFSQVKRCEIQEDIRLQECHEEFEEPEGDNDDTSESESSTRDERSDIGHYSDEHYPGEYIGEETNGEWHDTSEFSDEVDPSDRHIDGFLGERVTAPVEEIVFEMMEKSFVTNRGELCDDDDRDRHNESRIGIGIDRSEIRMSSGYHEIEPVEHKSEHIPQEDEDEKSSGNR